MTDRTILRHTCDVCGYVGAWHAPETMQQDLDFHNQKHETHPHECDGDMGFSMKKHEGEVVYSDTLTP